MAENPFEFGLNFLRSPFYGLTESLADLGVPGAEGALDWGVWGDTAQWSDEHPGWALGAELASYLVPIAGWMKAVPRGAGLLGGGASVGRALGGSSPTLRYALGETGYFAPLNLGLTGFDYAAGRYDDLGQAATGFTLGQLLGVGASAFGASRGVNRVLGSLPGVGPALATVNETILGPSPQMRAFYGMPEAQLSARHLDALISEFDPVDAPQQQGRRLLELRAEVEAGTRTDVDLGTLDELALSLRRESLAEVPNFGEGYVRMPYPTPAHVRNFLTREFTPGESSEGGRVRETLVRQPGSLRDADRIREELDLPENFEFLGRYYRHLRTDRRRNADSLRRGLGLAEGKQSDMGFRRIERLGSKGPQVWSIRQEDQGMWILNTELPQAGNTRRFLMFKTDRPDDFFPHMAWARNIDNPWDFRGPTESLGSKAWDPIDDLPETIAPFFDKAREVKKTILNPEHHRAMARASRLGRDSARALAARLRDAGDATGIKVGRVVEHYLKPTLFQFRNNPIAAMRWNMTRAVFDMGEAWKQEIVYGKHGLNPDKDIWAGVFGKPVVGEEKSLYSEAQRLLADDATREQWRKLYFEDQVPLEQWPEGPAKEFQLFAKSLNDTFVSEFNATMKALDQDTLSLHPNHIGVGHHFEGSNFYPIYNADNEVVAFGVAESADRALADAHDWVRWRRDVKLDSADYRIGEHFTAENFATLPRRVREAFFTPGFYLPQSRIGGFKWEREAIRSVDELVSALDKGYSARTRHLADRVAEALTRREAAQLLYQDPATAEVLATRINALKGVPGAFDRLQNRVLDKALAPVLGVNSATKVANAINEAMFHLSFGAGNIGFPVLNATSIFQTTLPHAVAVLSSADDELARMMYYLPAPGSNGKPRGIYGMYHAPGSLWRANKILKNPTDMQREVFERLSKDADLGPRYTEEYLGQNRQAVTRISDAVKSPDDFAGWIKNLSSFLPAQSEKLARTYSAAVALDVFEKLAAVRGVEFTPEQLFRNVQTFVRQTNYLYAKADRPQVFTTPVGSLFGGFKNWMTHYLFTLADYTGLAARGNFAPILMASAGMMGLGGLAAVPLLNQGLDWTTETFADQDLLQFLYSNMNEGSANALAFGLPAALGVSMSGATAAPGSRFAHDVEFLFTTVALERMKNMARGVGRGWDLAFELGVDPWQDPVFRQQMIQGFAPRSFYRTYEVLTDDMLQSARTGYPLVDGLSPMDRTFYAMGFTTTDIEREYAIYDRMIRDNEERTRQVSLFGEAYYQAMAIQDQDLMEEIIRLSAARGVDLSSVMRSAQRRARDAGLDMFGRIRGGDPESYEAVFPQ